VPPAAAARVGDATACRTPAHVNAGRITIGGERHSDEILDLALIEGDDIRRDCNVADRDGARIGEAYRLFARKGCRGGERHRGEANRAIWHEPHKRPHSSAARLA